MRRLLHFFNFLRNNFSFIQGAQIKILFEHFHYTHRYKFSTVHFFLLKFLLKLFFLLLLMILFLVFFLILLLNIQTNVYSITRYVCFIYENETHIRSSVIFHENKFKFSFLSVFVILLSYFNVENNIYNFYLFSLIVSNINRQKSAV